MAHVSGFPYLSYLWLYLRIHAFTLHCLCQRCHRCPHYYSLCFQGLWCFAVAGITVVTGVTSGGIRMAGTSATFRVACLAGTTAIAEREREDGEDPGSQVWRLESWTPVQLERPGSWVTPHCYLIPCGCGCHCSQGAGIMCISPPTAPSFFVTTAFATVAGRLGMQAPLLLFLWFHLLYVFPSTIRCIRCVDLSGILVCWAEVRLSYGCFTRCNLKGKEETKVASHTIMMLTSSDPSVNHEKTGLSKGVSCRIS